MLCFAMPADLSFFRYEICSFLVMEFRRFAHRKHSQGDAGMNLAFFKFDIIIGGIILSQTLYLSFFIMERRYRNLHCEFLKLDQ